MTHRLAVGDTAPAFETKNEQGERIALEDFRGQRIVLYFYPKDDTPGCTTQACAFRDEYDVVTGKNAVVFGVSPDDAESHIKFRDKHTLPFPLLLDEDHSIAEAYGAWGEKNMYGRKFMGIIRSQFVIDEEGTLIDVKYRIRPKDSVSRALGVLA